MVATWGTPLSGVRTMSQHPLDAVEVSQLRLYWFAVVS